MSEAELRDFDVDAADETEEPSGEFKLGGKVWRVRNRDRVSIGFLNIFNKDGTVQIGPFFRATIHPDDLDAFLEMIEQPDGPLTKANASAVIDHVTGVITDRPTAPATGSSTGSKPTGRKSAAGSSSRATRQRRSA